MIPSTLLTTLIRHFKREATAKDGEGILQHFCDQPSVRAACDGAAILAAAHSLETTEDLLNEVSRIVPYDSRSINTLARICLTQREYEMAEDLLIHSLRLDPSDVSTSSMMAVVLVLSEKINQGLTVAKEVLALDPGNLFAAAACSQALLQIGALSDAKMITDQALTIHQRRAWRSLRSNVSRGKKTIAVIGAIGSGFLTLTPGGMIAPLEGHSNIAAFLRHIPGARAVRYLVDIDDEHSLPKADLFVNSIAEPDLLRSPLERLNATLEEAHQYVINHPISVLRSKRDRVGNLCNSIDGLVVPETIRVEGPDSRSRFRKATQLLSEGAIELPILVRPVGSHTGQVNLVTSEDEIKQSLFEAALDGTYLTKFVDCQGEDGHWRKTRAVFVGDTLVLEHHYIANEFCVRSKNGRMFAKLNLWADKEAASVTAKVDVELKIKFDRIQRILGLDVFAIDFTRLSDGRILIFEASPCVRLIRPVEAFLEGLYTAHQVANIEAKFESLIAQRFSAAK